MRSGTVSGVFCWGLVILLAGTEYATGAIAIDDVLEIISVSKDVIVGLAKAFEIVDEHFDMPATEGENSLPVRRTERLVFKKLAAVGNRLDDLNDKVEIATRETINTFLHDLPQQLKLHLRLNDLLDYATRLNVFYKSMGYYLTDRSSFERLTLEDFARTVVSHDTGSVRALLERIHAFVAPSGTGITDTGIFSPLRESLQEAQGDLLCSIGQSPQQVLYNLYNSIALTELKGYMMMQFSYMLLKLYEQGNFTTEAQIMRDRYQERTNLAIEAVKKSMKLASRDVWKCDPKKHVEDETFVEITQLLQGYIQNEVDLNPEGTCKDTCSEYQYTKSHGCFKNLYCRQQRRCNGKIINCRFVDSDMWVCPADSYSGRRYDYIEYENGRVLGRKKSCRKGVTKVDSWWRWIFWHCSYCFCLCDEQGLNSDRYFNLRPALANFSNDMVVTGLRFVKKNRIVHLQIQEGKLLPKGSIDTETIRWVPVEEYKITDRNVFNGQDYHTLGWEKRAFDLDDLQADKNHVVTGIRFKTIGAHLNFEIYITPFDFVSGKLIEPQIRSMWKDNSNTDASDSPRKLLKFGSGDVSTRSPIASRPDSTHDQYVEFTHTDVDRDAAQTTIPFLDAQPVESTIPVPLAGAGMYHKGQWNYGGFIAPKIITYDFSPHLQAAFPETEPQIN